MENIPTQRAVASISQDKMGFIWMGTNGLGLNKFNGTDYKSYHFIEGDSSSLNNSLVHTSYVDNKNRLWIGTESGLNLYNRDQDNFIRFQLDSLQPEAQISVQAIFECKNGDLLIGTHQHGLFKINGTTLKVSAVVIKGIREIRNLLINSIALFDNKILIGSNRGLLYLNKQQTIVFPFGFTTSSGEKKIDAFFKTMEIDAKGSIWLGTNKKGLFKVDRNENGRYEIEHFSITSKRILSLLDTPRKTILCGTENDGLFEIGRDGKIINHYLNNKFDNHGIKSNSIWSLFLDNQNRIWIGYYNNGVAVYDKFYDKFKDIKSKPNYSNSLQSSSVTGILKDEEGRLWIGMDGGGVDVYNPQKNKFTHLLNTKNNIANGLNSPDVQTLFKDSKGNIWVGTWDYGIYFLKKGSKNFVNYAKKNLNGEIETNRIISFSEDSKGTIWIGTFSSGLHSFNPSTGKFNIYDQEPFIRERITYSDIRKVYVDSEDNIWIGGNSGLFRLKIFDEGFKLQSMSSRFYTSGNHTYSNLILDIYEDSSKNIWIGTEGGGLCKYDMQEDSFVWVDSKMNFDKATVSSILEDDAGILWVAGNNGIAKINREKKSIKNFTTKDGLLSNDFNNNAAYKDEKGNLYFGSYEGINYFDPNELPKISNTPPVYLSGFKIFNQPVIPGPKNSPIKKVISQTDKITLKHNQSVFTLDYASIDFTRPGKIQFAYYLEGFENSWNYVKNSRSATYTNLPAGEYTFRVKAANSDGIWNKDSTALSIEILRPWWFTNLAIILYALLFLILSFLIFKFISSRVKAKRLIAQEREKYIQEEALNAKKIQFFTNISHEFRTPLTLILSPLEDILKEKSTSKKNQGKLNIIYKNANRLKRLIDELMDFRKLQFNEISLKVTSFNIEHLLIEVVDYFKEEAKNRNIALSLEIEGIKNMLWADKTKLEKIVFNILSNAFKSTANNGIIIISAKRKEAHSFKLLDHKSPMEALEIAIEDTGKGIHPNEISKIFDRFYQIKDRNEQYYSGTGIGLEVVKSFVALHKGDIVVESEMGVGTKFRIFLPIRAQEYKFSDDYSLTVKSVKKHVEHHDLPQPEISTNLPQDSKNTLLLVEDNIELSAYIQKELKSKYKILLAENGAKGLEQAKKYLPDVIITDVIMPKMNGYELCKELKSDLKTSHIPVLMLTAKSMADDWVEGLEAGADAYLGKPFKMKVLCSHLKQLIENRRLLFSKYMGNFQKMENDSKVSSLDQQFILNIISFIKENIQDPNLNVEKLADEFNLSRSQLYRKIKALTGQTANELIREIRLKRAKELLEEKEAISISEICFSVGFSSPSYFSKCFKDYFGILPKEIRKE